MAFIKLGKVNKKFLIPVIGGVILLVYRFLIIKYPKYEILTKNPFIYNIYISLGMILAFIPYLILKHRSKSPPISETTSESKLNSELTRNEKSFNNNFFKFKLILLSTLFDFLQSL